VKYGEKTIREQGWKQDVFHGVNCVVCGVNNRGLCGWTTKEEAAKAWNRRSALTASEAAAQDHIEQPLGMVAQEAQEPIDFADARRFLESWGCMVYPIPQIIDIAERATRALHDHAGDATNMIEFDHVNEAVEKVAQEAQEQSK
jgi:hypothetical protein